MAEKKFIIAEGGLSCGYKFYGCFDSVDEAVRAIALRQPLMLGGTVLEVLPIGQHPVEPIDDANAEKALQE